MTFGMMSPQSRPPMPIPRPRARLTPALLLLAVVVLAAGACSGSRSDATPVASAPTEVVAAHPNVPVASVIADPRYTPTPDPNVTPRGLHPRDTHTGIAAVDSVIDVVAAQDPRAFAALMKASHVSCTRAPVDAAAGVRCPSGVPAGTLVEVFPTGSCQLEWIYGVSYARESTVQSPFPTRWPYAAYRTDEPVLAHHAGELYVLIFGSGQPFPPPLRVYVDASDGRIVQTDNACAWPLESIRPASGNPILAPVPTPYVVPTLTPAPRPTPPPPPDPAVTPPGFYPRGTLSGVPVVDRVLEAVAVSDGEALGALVQTQARICTNNPRALTDDVRCPAGVPDATVVEVFPSGSCNLGWIYGADEAQAAVASAAERPFWVYSVDGFADAAFFDPGGETFLIVLGQGRSSGTIMRLWVDSQSGAILMVGGACGLIESLRGGATSTILPPLP